MTFPGYTEPYIRAKNVCHAFGGLLRIKLNESEGEMWTNRRLSGLTFALFVSCMLVVPDAVAQFPQRECDVGAKKLSFGVYFRDAWTGAVNAKAGAKAEFTFGDTNMGVVVRDTSGDPSDVRVTLHDMLEMPLLGGENYRLCFSVEATSSLTVLGRFIKTVPPEVGRPLQAPETCTFQIGAGYSDQSCEFVPRETTESDEFVFFLGKAEPGTEIQFTDLKLYILK